MAIFDWEWGRNSAPRDGQGPEVHGLFLDKFFDPLPGSHVASL